MTSPLDSLIDHGLDILSTTIDNASKRILAYLGDVKAKLSDSDAAQWIQHVGFASRPRKPEAGKSAAQAVVIRRSDRDVVIGSSDSRTQDMYGQLDDGETALFGSDGQGRILIKKDGSVNLYTRQGNTEGGKGMTIMISPATNKIALINGSGYGIIIDDDGVKITAKDSGLTLNADGSVKLIGKTQTQVDGSTVLLGSVAVPGVNSALHGPAGLAGVASLKVIIE